MRHYKYVPGQVVLITSFTGVELVAEVFSRYTSDEYNHPAIPHRRYVVIDGLGEVYDLAEIELEEEDNGTK